MKIRVLIMLNFLGCVLLVGVIVLQWREEWRSDRLVDEQRLELAEVREMRDEQAAKRAALEKDVALLKESLEATQKAAEEKADDLDEQLRVNEQLSGRLEAAEARLVEWDEAVKARDERIRKLGEDLAEARKRLDEAIAKLKVAR